MLRETFSYCPRTGVMSRRMKAGGFKPCSCSLNLQGYKRVMFCGRAMYQHRLAFFLMEGRWPKDEVDHKNLDRSDNRWDNLREATKSENMSNVKSNNVTFDQRSGRWVGQVTKDRQRWGIGSFDCIAQAVKAAKKLKREVKGDFAHG
jgi:hypothetical protein